jgi:hypothetical protein
MMSNLVSTGAIQGNFTMTTSMNSGMMSDDLSEPSSPESSFDASDILGTNSINDDVTAQLANSGMRCYTPGKKMLSGMRYFTPEKKMLSGMKCFTPEKKML